MISQALRTRLPGSSSQRLDFLDSLPTDHSIEVDVRLERLTLEFGHFSEAAHRPAATTPELNCSGGSMNRPCQARKPDLQVRQPFQADHPTLIPTTCPQAVANCFDISEGVRKALSILLRWRSTSATRANPRARSQEFVEFRIVPPFPNPTECLEWQASIASPKGRKHHNFDYLEAIRQDINHSKKRGQHQNCQKLHSSASGFHTVRSTGV